MTRYDFVPKVILSAVILIALLVVASRTYAGQPSSQPTAYDRQQDARIAALESALAPPSPTPVASPTPAPTPTATAAPATGWIEVFRDDYATWDASRYYVYPGWPDTREKQQAGAGSFYTATPTASGGLLDIPITYRSVMAFIPAPGNMLGMRVEFRIRADSMHGYKGAPLLWPASNVWPSEGEINWPEGNFDGAISAFMHRTGATTGSDQDAYGSSARWQDWHTYAIEWRAGVSAEFFLDGTSIGKSTSRVPSTAMHLVMQFESALDGGVRDPAVSGHIQIDYLAVWRPA